VSGGKEREQNPRSNSCNRHQRRGGVSHISNTICFKHFNILSSGQQPITMSNHLKLLSLIALTFLQSWTSSYLITPPQPKSRVHLDDIPEYSSCTGLKNEIYEWRGQQIRYIADGPKDSKHSVLLVHGLFVNADQWRYTIRDLAQAGYRTYALDLLGSGYSSKPLPNSLEARLLNGEIGRFCEDKDQSVDELPFYSTADMIIDLVATRNIKKGEEVLLDYGNDWANAWNEHVKNWKTATKDAKLSQSAMVLNEMHHGSGKPIKPFPTSSEESIAGDNVQLMCHLLYDEEKIERRRNQDGSRTKVYPWIPHPVNGEHRLKTDLAVRGINRMDCVIEERTGDETTGYKYVVRPIVEKAGPKILVKNVPHDVIRYVDRPYTNPQHEGHAFRHSIRFPDDVFPEAWKDLKDGYVARDEL
jgi:hypothetical protein